VGHILGLWADALHGSTRLIFSPQMKFMYQIYLFFTPLHCHPAKCNPGHTYYYTVL
jgi:hypothetical protein